MKFLALVPFRNESNYLPLFLDSLSDVVDGIVGYDDGSTDDSRDIFLSNGGFLVPDYQTENFGPGTGATLAKRQSLLDEGRRLGGTHFLVVDCDEILIGQNRRDLKSIASELQPGNYISMNLLTCWQDFNHYISGEDTRKERRMDFIFADDPSLMYRSHRRFVHFDRIPRSENPNFAEVVHFSLPNLAFLHLSYINNPRAQIKQAWYRVYEKDNYGRHSKLINETYSFTLQDPKKLVYIDDSLLPKSLDSQSLCQLKEFDVNTNWHFIDIVSRITNNPPAKFLNLDIWHINALSEIYERSFGRTPSKNFVSVLSEHFQLRIIHIYFLLRSLMRKANGDES